MFDIEFNGEAHTIDPGSLVADEWQQVALELGAFALSTGVEPDVEVKAAAVALVVLRRLPAHAGLPFSALVEAPSLHEQPLFVDLSPAQQLHLLVGMSA